MPRQRAAPDLIDDEPGYGARLVRALGRLVSAHPSLAGGSVAFTVIFGFVAANALWNQPGVHPAPIFKTREVAAPAVPVSAPDPGAPTTISQVLAARRVTTYRIEHSDETPTASIPVPDIAAPPAPRPLPQTSAADQVLSQIQEILAGEGFYKAEIDGLMGPQSAAAIRAWEKTRGYAETGKPTPGLLAVMRAAKAPAKPVELARIAPAESPTPPPRPAPAVETDRRAGEPVTVPAQGLPDRSELVRQIQSGLSNIAYADITVDGVAGSETKAAIGAFEKHYRLPVTGEPNLTVLEKLLEIGAL